MASKHVMHKIRYGGMCAERHFLPCGYRERNPPEYYYDDALDGVVWQPDVYPYAADIARSLKCDAIIDLGCGRVGKLAALAARNPSWSFVGVDTGPNIEWCAANHTFGCWLDANLENCSFLEVSRQTVERSVIVCSDVLEHLINPSAAVALTLSLLRLGAKRAVFSTPARELRSGSKDIGPPANTAHVREWASPEFRRFLRASGLRIQRFSLTRSNDDTGELMTQLVLTGL